MSLILGSYGFGSAWMQLKLKEHITNTDGKMLIIPLASENGEELGKREKSGAVTAGFAEENVFVLDEENPTELLDTDYDYIDVTGGNTFRLLHYVRKYKLDSFIKQQVEKGADYLGFSAGAYLACPNIEYVREFDDNNHITDGDFTALGLTDKYVLCHYDDRAMLGIIRCRKHIGMEAELKTVKDDELIKL